MAHRVRLLRSASLAFAGLLCLAASPGDAAGRGAEARAARAAKSKPAKAVTADPKIAEKDLERTQPTAVWTSGEQERACYHGRRKLWQDGQGWVVKRVSICP